MLSRITIEVDFENGNQPVLQIIAQDSDDVRDKLVSQFLQSLGHTGRWGVIEYKSEISEGKHRWGIKPLTIRQLAEVEMPLMEAAVKECLPVEKPQSETIPERWEYHPQAGGGYAPKRFA